MPIPHRTVLTRLAALSAVPADTHRPTHPFVEVFTGTHLADIALGTADDTCAAITAARRAQPAWAARSPRDRASILDRFHLLLMRHLDDLMDMTQAETGKARRSALEEVLDIATNARYYALTTPAALKPRAVKGMVPLLTRAVVHHHPKGVVGIISPWNYPMGLPISDAIAALAAGNSVVIKPDLTTPFSALACAELLYEAGVPREVLAVVPGDGPEVGGALAESCDYLMFTGSTTTGRTLAEITGRRLIGFSAELGGKNPMIITAGADLTKAAAAAVRACFANSGQLCVSIERIYVQDTVAEEFTARFCDRIAAMSLAAGYTFDADMGSMSSLRQLETVTKHLADAVSKGATVRIGGQHRPDLGPWFFEPTVLTGVTAEMDCATQETFGPLVAIYPVADTDDAITRANDSAYGLNASVWAATDLDGEKIAAQLRTGTVNVNEGYAAAWGSVDAPMGGMGDSGLGRRHGIEGLLKYTETQTIATQRLLDLGGPSWLAPKTWAALLPWTVRAMRLLPGR